MSTLKEIDAQLAVLQAQREVLRQSELKEAISQARSLAAEYGLTSADVFLPSRGRSAVSRVKVAAKYRDPVSGSTWTGRGKAPKWIKGQDRAQYAIKE